jgi:hypothetical protein
MARLAGDLAVLAATPERLAALRRDVLVPVELEVVAGGAELSTRTDAISHLRNQLALSGPQDHPGRAHRQPAGG